MKIEEFQLDRKNANKGTDRGRELLRESLHHYGAGRSILVDKNGKVIAGNKTLQAVKDGGIDDVIVVETDGSKLVAVKRVDLDLEKDEKARLLAYADNRTSELDLDWDVQKILDDLNEGIDLSGLWNDDEVEELLKEIEPEVKGLTDEDEIPEDVETRVKSGEVWQCGEHRIMCGDSTKREDVERLMAGKKAVLGFTSPPYWVGKEYEKEKSIKEINEFIKKSCESYNLVVEKDESRIVINTSTGYTTSFEKRMKRQVLLLIDKWTNNFFELGWNLRHCRHWIKNGQLVSISHKSDLIDQHSEFLLTFENDMGEEKKFNDILPETDINLLATFYNTSGKSRGRVWQSKKYNTKRWAMSSYWDDIVGIANQSNHCASFPVELVVRHLLLYSLKGETVLDLFAGAGTTMIACERFNRVNFSMEIEPKYCDVAIRRWEDFTGKKAMKVDG